MLLGVVVCLIFALVVYLAIIEPRAVEIQRLKVETSKNIKNSQKFVFISDLHIGFWDHVTGMGRKIRKLRQACEKEVVQAILIAGDIIDLNDKYLPRLRKYLKDLKLLEIPIIVVTGNHDFQSHVLSLTSLERVLRQEGVVVLKNSSIIQGDLQIIGIRDLQEDEIYKKMAKKWHNQAVKKVVQNIGWYENIKKDDGLYLVVLSHNPDAVYLPGEPRPDLVLAGHTHGGQIALLDWLLALHWIPFSFRRFLPLGTYCTKAGLLTEQGVNILISRGLGSSGVPFRFLRRPQIHFVEIEKESD